MHLWGVCGGGGDAAHCREDTLQKSLFMLYLYMGSTDHNNVVRLKQQSPYMLSHFYCPSYSGILDAFSPF